MNHPSLPKPLVPFLGKPLLEWVIEGIANAGITNTIIVVGWRGDQIEDRYGSSYNGMTLAYARQLSPLGTADAISRALPLVRTYGSSLVALADILVAPSWYSHLVASWRERPSLDSLFSIVLSDPSQGSLVTYDSSNLMTSIVSRPNDVKHGWRDGGISIHSFSSLSDLCALSEDWHGERRMTIGVDRQLSRGRLIGVERYLGKWYDMVDSEVLANAEKEEFTNPLWLTKD